MISARPTLLLLALAACESRSPAPTPAVATDAARPAARPVVRSCPTVTRPGPVGFDPRVALGDHDGITWLFGHAGGEPVLAHLGADDRLALTPVPLADVTAGTIAGGHIWLASATPSARWLAVDIRDPERPVAGAIVPVTTGARDDAPFALAVGARRALALLGPRGALDLVLVDTATWTPVAAPQPLDLTFRPLHSFCGADNCSVLGVDHEPELEPPNGIVVLRTLPDGTRERERVGADWIGDPAVARHGEQRLVAWPTRDGVRVRALDGDGHPLAPAVPVPWDSKRELRELRLFHAGGAVVLALAEEDRWSVAPVGPHGNPGPLRALPGATRHSLFAAPLADGLAWINLGEDVLADDPGESLVMIRSWRVDAVGGFLPNEVARGVVDEPTPATPLAVVEGGGRGRLEAHVLTRPGAAAALIVPRDDATRVFEPSFALVRASCRPTPAAGTERAPLELPGPGDDGCRDEPR